MPQETEKRLEEWAELIGEDLSEEAASLACERSDRTRLVDRAEDWSAR